MEKDMTELLYRMRQSEELGTVMAVNGKSSQYGLSLTQEEARELVWYRNQTLRKHRRIEFGGCIYRQDRECGQAGIFGGALPLCGILIF